jgi:TPR repeat protein
MMSQLQNLINAANNGDIYAMMDLGVSYRFAYSGAKRDLDEAMKWFGMAAQMVHPEVFCYMGYALEIPVGYLDPNDDKADYKRAFGYFVKGALLDDANSIYKVGDMYYSGKYVDVQMMSNKTEGA